MKNVRVQYMEERERERESGGEGNSSGIPTSVLLWNTDVFVRKA